VKACAGGAGLVGFPFLGSAIAFRLPEKYQNFLGVQFNFIYLDFFSSFTSAATPDKHY